MRFSLLDFKCAKTVLLFVDTRLYSRPLELTHFVSLKCYTCWLEIIFLTKINELLAFLDMLSNCLEN